MTEPKLPSAPSPAGETDATYAKLRDKFNSSGLSDEEYEQFRKLSDARRLHRKVPEPVSTEGAAEEEDWFPYPSAAPIAPAAVSEKVGSVAGWTLYRAVRDFLDSARAGTPFGLEVMDAAVSEWEAENPPRAKPSAEGDGWIAVTERLPDEGVKVLAYDGQQGVASFNPNCICTIKWRGTKRPTHWRLLPAPPSGQGEKA